MISPEQVAQFRRDGFFIARGVFRGGVLERLEALAAQLRDRVRRELPEGTRFWFGRTKKAADATDAERSLASWGVNEITRPSLFEPELVNVFAHAGVQQQVEALLGPEPRAWGIKLLWTPKLVGYNLGWHRDQLRKDLYDYVHLKPAAQDHIQFNGALHPDDCFIVVPGSHRRPLTGTEWEALRSDPTAELPGEVRTQLDPGDILYMDAHALHRGRSDVGGDRLTLHYSLQAQWVPLKPWGAAEDFEWITSDAFLARIAPGARPLYERLRTAERTADSMSFVKSCATEAGWVPDPAVAEAVD